MILSCYIYDLRRHLNIFSFIPSFAPYEWQEKTNLITVSRSKYRRRMYQGSQLVSLATFVSMCYFQFSKSYDIFLILFGLTILTVCFTAIMTRWNLSVSSKCIDVLNQFLIFEKKIKFRVRMNSIHQTCNSNIRFH